jgi:hypothetical protein
MTDIKETIKAHLQAAEMRQGTTDYAPYVDALMDDIESEIQSRVEHATLSPDKVREILYRDEWTEDSAGTLRVFPNSPEWIERKVKEICGGE